MAALERFLRGQIVLFEPQSQPRMPLQESAEPHKRSNDDDLRINNVTR